MDNAFEMIGLIAGMFTTLSFIPQVLHVWKHRSVKDISTGMYVIFCSGLVLWIIYGFFLNSMSLIFANIVTLILAATILVMKLLWHKPNH